MGFMNDANDDQVSVAFATASNDNIFPDVKDGEVLLDESIQDQGVEIGDKLTSDQLSKDLTVAGFVEQEKFSHSPVAFISEINYQEMYRTEEIDRKSTRLNSSHVAISYAVFCLKKKNKKNRVI